MMEPKLRRELFKAIKSIQGSITEGASYGVPHIFGEIREDKVDVTVTIIENGWLRMMIPSDGEGTLRFVYPADEVDVAGLFMDLWRFLNGKSRDRGDILKPGARIKGSLEDFVKRKGFTVLWINRRDELSGYVQMWIKKGPVRYSVLLRKSGEDEFTIVELKRM